MSRIGKQPIAIPGTVTLVLEPGNAVRVSGPKGELAGRYNRDLKLIHEDGSLVVERPDNEREHRSLHGLTRTLINNMVIGVTEGYRRNLEIHGVGYRAALDGKTLVLSVGYSHPVRMVPPDGIEYALENPTRLSVVGIDKQLVGEEAARIRRVRSPEPYKGKGIRYAGERVRRKAGKAGKAK